MYRLNGSKIFLKVVNIVVLIGYTYSGTLSICTVLLHREETVFDHIDFIYYLNFQNILNVGVIHYHLNLIMR